MILDFSFLSGSLCLYPDFQNDLGGRLLLQPGRPLSGPFRLLDIGIGEHQISNGSNQSVITVDKLT
jgi:hypothetical protein